MEPVIVDGEGLSLEAVELVAVYRHRAVLADTARPGILASRRVVEKALASKQKVYGVTTGLGHLSEISLDAAQSAQLQDNMVRSHSAGVGDEFPPDICRAMMLLRANTLAKGYSGVRLEVIESLLALLNAGVTPVVPQQGSVGASGDLVPLAHVALLLTGQGKARRDGALVAAADALSSAGLSPLVLGPKEALALVNGTQAMAAVGTLTLLAAERLARLADIAAALSLEALRGTAAAFDERIHRVRPVPGQLAVASNMRRLLADSQISAPGKCARTQDAYSLRCIPQVHGAVREILGFVRRLLEIEINSATDNPLIFAEDEAVISGGNFHGEPIALSMDSLALGLTELANISDRRTARLVDPHLSGLPSSLSEHAALGCSFGILQIVTASLASENRALAHPASADNIPTAGNQEDHVSMGPVAARKARDIARNLEQVLAIEFLCAAQGLDFVGPHLSATGVRRAHQIVRSRVAWLDGERSRIFHDDIAAVAGLLHDGQLLAGVQEAVGRLD